MSLPTDSASPPRALDAREVPVRARPSNYPEPFASMMRGRSKRALGDAFGLRGFGVNLTTLAPGAVSALMHRHTVQDELVYVLDGHPTLCVDDAEVALAPGRVAGFPAGGVAHRLENRTDRPVVYLEIGDRRPGDTAEYPRDDLRAALDADGRWTFTRKDGRPW